MSCEHRQPAPATRNCYTWKMLTLCLCSQEPAKPRRTTLPVFLERLVSSSLLKTVRQQNIDSWQLLLFLSSQHETLHQHLLSHGYVINQNKKDRIFFFFKFSTSWFMLSYHKLKDAFFFFALYFHCYFILKKSGEKVSEFPVKRNHHSLQYSFENLLISAQKLARAVITQPDAAEDFRIACVPLSSDSLLFLNGSRFLWLAVVVLGECLMLSVPVCTKLISVPRTETLTWADRYETHGVGRNKKRTLTEASCYHGRTQPPPKLVDKTFFWWGKTKSEPASSKHI